MSNGVDVNSIRFNSLRFRNAYELDKRINLSVILHHQNSIVLLIKSNTAYVYTRLSTICFSTTLHYMLYYLPCCNPYNSVPIDIQVSKVNLVGDRDNFVWKGHSSLTVVSGDTRYNAGFQPQCILQITPPAACTALSVHTEWQL